MRGMYENNRHNGLSVFCTLTYSNLNLPKDHFLNKDDTDKFWKRLRVNLDRRYGVRIKYVLTGEYGSRGTLRPHYHAVVWGAEEVLKKRYGIVLLRSEIERAWGSGFVDVEHTISKNLSYVLKYIVKDKYKSIGQEEFNKNSLFTSSRRPAIGKLTDEDRERLIDKIYTITEPSDMTIVKGRYRYAIPRYWLKSLPKEVYSIYSEIANEFADEEFNRILNNNTGLVDYNKGLELDNESRKMYTHLAIKYKKFVLLRG